jgi:hypothetical protein
MYRSCDLIEADVEARLGRGEGAVGYSTCLCHSVLQAQPVFDRQGWFGGSWPDATRADLVAKAVCLTKCTITQ